MDAWQDDGALLGECGCFAFDVAPAVRWECPPDCACPTLAEPSGQVRVLCSVLARVAS